MTRQYLQRAPIGSQPRATTTARRGGEANALNYQTSAAGSDDTEQGSPEERLSVKAQMESLEVSTYREVGKREVEKFTDKKRQPKELSQMMIRQDVLVARVNNPGAAGGQYS